MTQIFANDQLETIDCPNCGGKSFAVLATTDRYKMGLRTVGCSGCGLVLTNPRPSAERMKKFYAEDYRRYYTGFSKPSAEYIAKFRRAERATHHVRYLSSAGVLTSARRILDVGCAEGSLLKAIRDECPQSERYGVEPNPDFRSFAARYADTRHIWPTSEEVLFDSGFSSFDLITVIHVLEHVSDPVAFLSALSAKLSNHGQVYVDVPDIASYRDIDVLHVAHLYHFSETTLEFAARKAGFDVVAMERHNPPSHPTSVRALLAPRNDSATALPQTHPNAERSAQDWDNIRQAMARSRGYFLRKSLLGRLVLNGPKRLLRLLLPRIFRMSGSKS